MISLFENATHVVATGEVAELRQLAEDLRFRPDGYVYNDRYTRYRVTQGREGWDGWSYPFKVTGNTAKVLRGHRDTVIALCASHGFSVNTSKLLPKPFASMHIDDVPADLIKGSFHLDDKQRRAIQQWLVNCVGIAEMAVGAGKTATFAGAAVAIKNRYPDGRVIYITQSERLVNQAVRDIKVFAPHLHISQFGGGKSDEDGVDMVICTCAMLNRHFARLSAKRWFKSFICLMFDEVHHCPSATAERIVMEIPAMYRFGATGSAQEGKEDRRSAMVGLFGPFRSKAQSYEYIETGRQAKPHIYLVDVPQWRDKFAHVGHAPEPDTPAYVLMDGTWTPGVYLGPVLEADPATGKPALKERRTLDADKEWTTVLEPIVVPGLHRILINGQELAVESRWCLLNRLYDRAITRFKERNNLIVQWAKHYSDRKLQTLVVCTRTLHIYILEALIAQAVDPALVRILFSKDSSGARDETFEWLKATPGAVLVTPLVKEGVSINEIRAGVVADYVADYDAATQILGRFVRKKKTGENRAEITWFVDNQAPSFRRGCNSLFRQLESVRGFTFYHPCTTPESVSENLSYEGEATPDFGAEVDADKK